MGDPRALPAVYALVDHPELAEAVASNGRELVVKIAREVIEAARRSVLDGGTVPGDSVLRREVASRVSRLLAPRPRRVVNATGVILHTNLGRAPVSERAADAMRAAAVAYCDLEYDLVAGERGSRHALLEPLLCHLTGAEAALVVNNNAGATLLILAALAQGRGAIVSRGQLVEIGGGYRIPSVMAASGARLVEVGTTNRTYVEDYRAAIDDSTALILRVHHSNYRIIGFASEATLTDLVALAHARGLVFVDDLGSGSLLDTSAFGLMREPMVTESIAAGADLATFSGDKLLGGPQAGVIVGKAEYVAKLRRHPLARALRPGKDTIAGLHATLAHYARGEATQAIPVWRMISATREQLSERAERWRSSLDDRGIAAHLAAGESAIGGGSLPGETLPTTLLAIETSSAERLAAALRTHDPAVLARIVGDEVMLDPRTVLDGDDQCVIDAMRAAFSAA